jgi:hypothetical protein
MRACVALLGLCTLHCPVAAHHDGPHHHHHPSAAPRVPTIEAAAILGQGAHRYLPVAGWCRLPDERPLGNTHGGIVIDQRGRIYFNTDTDRSIMVYGPEGSWQAALAPGLPGIHGMVIRREDGEEFIYAAHLQGKAVVKLRLDGSVVWTMGVPLESGKYDDNPAAYNPTAVAVGPGGEIFVADGYGRHWIHQFTAQRAWVRSFGGPGSEPGRFNTPHGLALDTRGGKPHLLVCDRENRRLQRFDLEGRHVDVPAAGLRRPCSISIRGDVLAVAELEGRVTLLDASFKVLAHLGDNPDASQWANNGVPPASWTEGVFTAPHAVCFDEEGNLYVMDWNAAGRISKLRREETIKPPAR